jgi:predicted ester cyclase
LRRRLQAFVDEYLADEELIQHLAFYSAAFPGYQVTPEDIIVEGDKAAVRAKFTGTHKGEMMGIAPTGKQVSMPALIVYRIAGGKVVEHWISMDRLELLEQLGIAPAME